MESSHGRKVTACAVVSLAFATCGITAAVRGSASAAENDPHPLVVQRVRSTAEDRLVASVLIQDVNSSSDVWCVNLNGSEGSWTDADVSVKVREGHSYAVTGTDYVNCGGWGYESPYMIVPVGLTTQKYWLTPNFLG